MIKYIWISLLLITISTSAQQLPVVSTLNNSINESSGIVYVNDILITHNDSGGGNELYQIDTATGNVERTIVISNATNVDWEDLAADDTFIYIADFGNNSGSRTDLKIYKVLISDVLNFNSVTAEVIEFSYKDQVDFTPTTASTDYDAEGLISFQDNLYIFTKQWTSQNTSVYELSKTPGNYELDIADSININGLVTSGTVSIDESTVLLTGYNISIVPFGFSPFIIELTGFSGSQFSNGTSVKTSISTPNGLSSQIEAIAPLGLSDFYLTSEVFNSDNPALFSYTSNSLGISDSNLNATGFYPNPSSDMIFFKNDVSRVEVYSSSGQLIIEQTHGHPMNITNIDRGLYLVVLTNSQDRYRTTQKLIVN